MPRYEVQYQGRTFEIDGPRMPTADQLRSFHTKLPPDRKTAAGADEQRFKSWYGDMSKQHDLDPDPDSPDQMYDYRAAFKAGATPGPDGHWPSAFKKPGHPNEVVGGFNTRTGARVPGTKAANEQELIALGWDEATARRLADSEKSPLSRIIPGYQSAVDVGKGALSGLLSTAYHGGDLIRRATGMERVIDDPAAQEAMTPPESMAGKVGFYGEQIGEFLAPAAKIASATKGSRLLTRMAAEGASGAGIAGVQSGGDPGAMAMGGAIGAVLPPVGAAVRIGATAAQRAAHGAQEGGLGGAIASAMRTAAPAAPKTLITQALKPRSTNTRFVESLDRSLPELKLAEEALGRPIAGIDDLIAATTIAKRRVRAQFNEMAGPAKEMGSTVDLSPVAKAMQASIPKRTALQSPQVAESVAAKADTYRQRFAIEDAEQLLRETNAELEGFYAKYPTAQRKVLASDPTVAALEAEATTLRNVIYMTLDNPGQGKAAREVQRRYGSLMRIEEEAYRRTNVAKRQQPESLSEQIGTVRAAGDMAKGAWRLMHGDLTGAADIASANAMRSAGKFVKEQQTTDALIARAFASFKGVPGKIDMPPPVQVKGFLGRGPLVTPAPDDASGVRATRAPVADYDATGRPIYSSDPSAPSARPPVLDAEFYNQPAARVPRQSVPDAEFDEVLPQSQRALPPSSVRGLLEAAPEPPRARKIPPKAPTRKEKAVQAEESRITPSEPSPESIARVRALGDRKEADLRAGRAPYGPPAKFSIRPHAYRGKQGFSVIGSGSARGRRVFVETREAAEHVKAKMLRGEDITTADFQFGASESTPRPRK